MSCTLEQIAEKKRVALELLQRARHQKSKPAQTATASQIAPKSSNSASQFLSMNSFYGTVPATGGGKIKSGNILQNHRTQPYSTQNKSTDNTKSGGGRLTQQLLFLPTKSANCSMISAERFVVEASFHEQMVDVMKAMPNREYGTVILSIACAFKYYSLWKCIIF